MHRNLVILLRWAVIVGLPIVLVLSSARLLVNPWYPRYEYSKPDFPGDPYGFTRQQRLALATVAIDHLRARGETSEHVDMLTRQQLPGSARPLYTPAEISHLTDVQDVMNKLWRINYLALLIVGASLIGLLVRRATRAAAADALIKAGLGAATVLLVLVGLVLLAWSTFFTQFHQVFFPQGNWTFAYESSLIRLFPQRFWLDAAVLLIGGSLAAALGVAFSGYLLHAQLRSD